MIWFFVGVLIFFLVLCCGAVVEFLVKRRQETRQSNETKPYPFVEVESPWTSAMDKRRSNKGKG